ncbi:alanine racemase [Streptomyces solicathayae]|uniref:Alanine racemase n=1 Tax=Streptomyces solicathayae TaxID=3081768 RepID=A0ABZ0LQ15_9ACTN|nr:alanine racemase [Streptomyces sp. HUAS YS2]WOX21306.1 alanine racemase [Streptomyces sp. HUAS YS2]
MGSTAQQGLARPVSPAGFAELEKATADLQPPFAVVDLGALRANAAMMTRRAGGKPIRLASKSLRCRALIGDVLRMPGFSGILAFTLPEALWLAEDGGEAPGTPASDTPASGGAAPDILVGYPTADVPALRRLASDERAAARITLMVDSVEHLDLISDAVGPTGPPVRICLDLDASLRLLGGRLHLGMRRSPLHAPEQAAQLARAVVARPRLRLVGVMSYEGQIAGVGDNQPGAGLTRAAVRLVQRASARELRARRAAAIRAVRAVAPLEFVNGGGTGSLEGTSAEPAVTELGAGSGIYAPVLFDHYRGFRPLPAAYFALSVVRRPAPRHVTVLGGGWIASGAPGTDRLPVPVSPEGLRLLSAEGAGEVQTPLVGAAADTLRLGDRVWFRHAKAGELCERVDRLHLVEGDRIVDVVPTYRGERHAFL